jgi:hypothetical protein
LISLHFQCLFYSNLIWLRCHWISLLCLTWKPLGI